MDLWPWLVVVVAVCVGAWRVHRRRGRARQLMLLCHRADLEFSPIDPFPDTLWLPFRWLGEGRWSRTENVVWNRGHGDDVRAFDLLIAEEPSEEDVPRTIRRSVCAAVALPFSCPKLEIHPRDSFDRVNGAIVGADVDLELGAFNRRFRVRAEDRRFAVAFCDQRMMQALMSLPAGITVAVNEDRLLLRTGVLPRRGCCSCSKRRARSGVPCRRSSPTCIHPAPEGPPRGPVAPGTLVPRTDR